MDDKKYAESHEWIGKIGTEYRLGISDFAQDQLGDVVYISFPDVGVTFGKGDDLCVIESVKAASDIYAPVTLKVLEVNSELLDKPELVNEDSEGEGWLLKVEVIDEEELGDLVDGATYKSRNN